MGLKTVSEIISGFQGISEIFMGILGGFQGHFRGLGSILVSPSGFHGD